MWRIRLPFTMALSVLLSQCGPVVSSSDIKVVGGTPAQAYPFMAAIGGEDGRQFCGGSFIRDDVVVTAAHCVFENRQKIWVAFNVTKLSEIRDRNKIEVSTIKIHPSFDDDKLHDDVALLFLDPKRAAEEAEEIEPVLLDQEVDLPHSTIFTAAGWGNATSEGRYKEDQLLEARLPVIANDDCRASGGLYRSVVDSQICAGYLKEGRIDTCNGDSGGPLFTSNSAEYILHGIVSWGEGCAEPGKPGVYARVSSFVPWIQDEVERYNPLDKPIENDSTENDQGGIKTSSDSSIEDETMTRPIGLKVQMDSETTGRMHVKNFLGKKIFGWQLSCNFSYSVNTLAGDSLAVNKNGNLYQMGVSSADENNGVLPSRSELEFDLRVHEPLDPRDRSKRCTINGYPVGWNDFIPATHKG